ncbi:fused MFS/spermidine synthase [Acinetobacter towneri]|uniref:fused MFS/spermidine synthase n=1 Tax=Acinetobacter towneri TaxID=202956 RepID=UPI002096F482|nr:fused MFS/spermidine synthase [Acinetobacter towneri]MCO8059726.1 fused MFS/spermidine synthase [Acinetobacter towneri]MCO8065451.1 fused MFS/spermidine synthase [Acinetobacter towneri]
MNSPLFRLALIFFISGFSALIYQTCWQRLLFTGFGVDLTSITIIISVFMAGLGIGAFFGGRIADYMSNKLILIFCSVELGIGLFGFFSYSFIHLLQDSTLDFNTINLAIFTFILLLFPTFLMGATLPILTKFFNTYIQNIGSAIGELYFYNTLGAAAGALSTGFFFFHFITLSQTIYIAATLNLLISLLIYVLYGKIQNEK